MINTITTINTHQLGVNNLHKESFSKNKIVIGNTNTSGLKHLKTWSVRLNGQYKRTAPYTITRDGKIYKHYSPKYYSNFIGDEDLDKEVIPIVLENQGWLSKDSSKETYLNWIGDIYNKELGIVDVKWRGREHWAAYTDEQIKSLVKLCRHLCSKFNIPEDVLSHNTKAEVKQFSGIVYRSNYSNHYTDISPAFNIKEFKNKLEENLKK